MKDYKDQSHYFHCDAPVAPASSQVQEAREFCARVHRALFVVAIAVAVTIYVCY